MSERVPPALASRVLEVARALRPSGLGVGTAGNVSARVDGGFAVTPSGLPYDALTPRDVVFVAMSGEVPPGQLEPSSEWRIHRDVYAARPDVAGVVHAHPPCATALACTRRELPAIHYMIAAAGGSTIRCAEYATFGTEALSHNALAALEGRLACLMANHGLLALGATVEKALALAVEVEALADTYLRVLAVGGGVVLSDAELVRVVELFKGYGTRNREGRG